MYAYIYFRYFVTYDSVRENVNIPERLDWDSKFARVSSPQDTGNLYYQTWSGAGNKLELDALTS